MNIHIHIYEATQFKGLYVFIPDVIEWSELSVLRQLCMLAMLLILSD